MNWRCRWFGHKRRSLDGDANGVSIRNIDGCYRCGVLLRAKHARGFSYEDKRPLPEYKPLGRIKL
jgi:hypothetical protein